MTDDKDNIGDQLREAMQSQPENAPEPPGEDLDAWANRMLAKGIEPEAVDAVTRHERGDYGDMPLEWVEWHLDQARDAVHSGRKSHIKSTYLPEVMAEVSKRWDNAKLWNAQQQAKDEKRAEQRRMLYGAQKLLEGLTQLKGMKVH